MCNDEALNVVICSMNANIHVVVHKDLHEINLLNVKSFTSHVHRPLSRHPQPFYSSVLPCLIRILVFTKVRARTELDDDILKHH
jgi:hypothetical protein